MKAEQASGDVVTVYERIPSGPLEAEKPIYRLSSVLIPALVHIPPLIISIGLTTLHHIKPFWFEQTDYFLIEEFILPFQLDFNAVILLIQVGAKLYETLVILSISHMALFMVRLMLVSTNGIPLGLLTSSFHVGHLGYLMSKRFLAFMSPPHFWTSKATCLAAFFALSTFLALAITPSSATLLIPQLGWHELPSPFSNVVMPLANYVEEDLVWPSVIKSSFVPPDWTCNLSNYSIFCPGAGLPVILNWVQNWRTSRLETSLSFQHNNLTRPLTFSSQPVDSLSSKVDATTPTDAVTNTIDNFWTYIKVNDHDVGPVYHAKRPRLNTMDNYPLFQPYVSAHCLSYDLDGLEQISTEVLGPSVTHFALEEIRTLLQKSNQNDTTDFAWIPTNSSSVGAIVGLPYANQSNPQSIQHKWWSICDISATWNRSTLHFDPTVSSDIGFQLSSDNPSGGSTVAVSPDFLDAVNFFRDTKANRTIIDDMWRQYLDSVIPKDTNTSVIHFAPQTSNEFKTASLQVSQVVSKTVSVIVADILSTLNDNYPPVLVSFRNQTHLTYTDLGTQAGASYQNVTTLIDQGNDPLQNAFVRVDFQVSRYGYVSGKSSVSMTFALVVNYIYAVTNVIFLVVFLFGVGCLRIRPVKAWGEIEELLALAFLSRQPPELKNCGAGVDEQQTWDRAVRVRADANNKVEMVFHECSEMNEISTEEKYN